MKFKNKEEEVVASKAFNEGFPSYTPKEEDVLFQSHKPKKGWACKHGLLRGDNCYGCYEDKQYQLLKNPKPRKRIKLRTVIGNIIKDDYNQGYEQVVNQIINLIQINYRRRKR